MHDGSILWMRADAVFLVGAVIGIVSLSLGFFLGAALAPERDSCENGGHDC